MVSKFLSKGKFYDAYEVELLAASYFSRHFIVGHSTVIYNAGDGCIVRKIAVREHEFGLDLKIEYEQENTMYVKEFSFRGEYLITWLE